MQARTAPTADEPRFLTIKDAAGRYGVSMDTVRRRIKDGTLPCIFLAGKYRIREDHLTEWAQGGAR